MNTNKELLRLSEEILKNKKHIKDLYIKVNSVLKALSGTEEVETRRTL